MNVVLHELQDIERAAARFPCVPTDNRDALIALGFGRMYPQASSGYESRLWVRRIELPRDPSGARRHVIQRAYLEAASGKSPR